MTKNQLTKLKRLLTRTNKLRLAIKALEAETIKLSDRTELQEAEHKVRSGQATLSVLVGSVCLDLARRGARKGGQVKLTKLEQEILEHRLREADCIAEAIGWDTVGVVRAAARDIQDSLPYLVSPPTGVREAVLEDAVSGSTYGAVSEGALGAEITEQKYQAIVRAGRSLARKVGEVIGREVEWPEN